MIPMRPAIILKTTIASLICTTHVFRTESETDVIGFVISNSQFTTLLANELIDKINTNQNIAINFMLLITN